MGIYQTDIIKKCKKHDRRAQLKLYNKYCDAMYTIAYRFMRNQGDAEDAMQEGFIKAFKKIDSFKGEVTFGAWLKRIVIHTCIDMLKSSKLPFSEMDETYLEIMEVEDWVIEDEITKEEVIFAIANLPPNYRLVVSLYLIEGYDHQEIASILGISVVNSRSLLMRGRNKLKELLKRVKNGTGS